MDDFQGSPYANEINDGPCYDAYDDNAGKSKNKTKGKDRDNVKDDKSPLETKYEAYILERATPKIGEKPSWSRICKRPMLFEEKKLVEGVKARRKRTGNTPQQDFKKLTPNQQDVINRIILDQKQMEKSKNADWVLADVQRIGQKTWLSTDVKDVKKIQIVLKRHDKNAANGGKYVTGSGGSSNQHVEIVDLNEPLDKKKGKDGKDGKDGKGGKKARKSKSFDDLGGFDDSYGLGIQPPQPANHRPRQPEHFVQPPMLPPMPQPGPIGPHPFDHNGPSQFQQPQFQQQAWPQNPRQSFHDENPFQPDPHIAVPGQFDSPQMGDQEWPHLHHSAREQRDSHSIPRRPSARRQSSDAKRLRKLETKLDNLNLNMEDWRNRGDSSEDAFDEDSTFSAPPSGDTPPSSPHSAFSDVRPKGSLERRRSSANPRYHPRRSYRYRDVEVEPEYTYRAEPRRYSPDHRRQARRPSLHHAATYDDYPVGRIAEPRFLPPQPRRLTNYAENYDYDDVHRQRDRERPEVRRRATVQYDPVQEAYEAGRREAARDGRRQSFVNAGRYD